MKKIITYQCDYCAKTSLSKKEMIEHEKTCSYNPINIECNTCIYKDNSNHWSSTNCKLGIIYIKPCGAYEPIK